MAVIKAVPSTTSKKSLKEAINYVTNPDKTTGLVTGINCNVKTAYEEMQSTKLIYDKVGGRQFKHLIQSFSPKDDVTGETAHQIGIDFVKNSPQFNGYEVIVATHKDKEHIHNHFIVNSVSFENGIKFRQSKSDLIQFRKLNDELCKKHNLSVCEKGKTINGRDREKPVAYSHFTYDLLNKADENNNKSSWVYEIAKKVVIRMKESTSKEEFINSLHSDGIQCNWTDNHKYITFVDVERMKRGEKCKIRDRKLSNYFNFDISKEGLLDEFTRNDEQTKIQRIRIDSVGRAIEQRKSGIVGKSGELGQGIKEGAGSKRDCQFTIDQHEGEQQYPDEKNRKAGNSVEGIRKKGKKITINYTR